MQGASRQSLAAAKERLDTLTDEVGSVGVVDLGEQLFAVADLLDQEVSLRRVLTDPARLGEAKAHLVRELFAGQVGEAAIELIGGMVRERWSRGRDLADALEELAVRSEVVAAERDGRLDDVEDELFRFGRIVASQPELRAALTSPRLPGERKAALVDALVRDKVTPVTGRLIGRLASNPRGRSVERGLEDYARLAAERRQRVIALVRVAIPLTIEQRRRLANGLERTYGHQVHLNVEIDPGVMGGISVQVGDEVIDGTVATRLDEAHRRLAD